MVSSQELFIGWSFLLFFCATMNSACGPKAKGLLVGAAALLCWVCLKGVVAPQFAFRALILLLNAVSIGMVLFAFAREKVILRTEA